MSDAIRVRGNGNITTFSGPYSQTYVVSVMRFVPSVTRCRCAMPHEDGVYQGQTIHPRNSQCDIAAFLNRQNHHNSLAHSLRYNAYGDPKHGSCILWMTGPHRHIPYITHSSGDREHGAPNDPYLSVNTQDLPSRSSA